MKKETDESILDSFAKLQDYFAINNVKIVRKHKTEICEFAVIYDEIAAFKGTKDLNANIGVAVGIVFRALKYLYSSLDLACKGHMDESCILFRNITELKIVALDIAFTNQGLELWNLTQAHREKLNQQYDGIINSKQLVNSIRESNGGQTKGHLEYQQSLRRLQALNDKNIKDVCFRLEQKHKVLSNFRSHENISNIVRRTETTENVDRNQSTTSYLGLHHTGDTKTYFAQILIEANELRNIFYLIVKSQ